MKPSILILTSSVVHIGDSIMLYLTITAAIEVCLYLRLKQTR